MAVSERPIVVGVDGAEHSRTAVLWATQEARRRNATLHLVLSSDPARADYAEETLEAVAAECRSEAPDLEIIEEVSLDHPVHTLVRRSAEAQLVVVGSRGHGGFVNALLGSVSAPLAAESACPVIVMRPAPARSGVPRGLSTMPRPRLRQDRRCQPAWIPATR